MSNCKVVEPPILASKHLICFEINTVGMEKWKAERLRKLKDGRKRGITRN